MVSLSLYPQFETNLMSNPKVIKLLLQLKSAKAHGKNYMKVIPQLVRHLQRYRLLWVSLMWKISVQTHIFTGLEVFHDV